MKRALLSGATLAIAALLAGCGGASAPEAEPALGPQATIGRLAFHDPAMSASGRVACASCHVPAEGHGSGAVQGLRAAQSLRYLGTNSRFHFDLQDLPVGGYSWDGRAASPAAQAGRALLGAREMGHADKASVAAGIARSAWRGEFEALYGADILGNPEAAFDRLAESLEAFQRDDPRFNAFTSKYDAVLRGEAALTAQEARGLAHFTDPAKGNCASCHQATPTYRTPPLFTNFSYATLGVPRNPEIAANADPAFYDLGVCAREELRDQQALCGAFRVPTLRNAALRQAFFHNGRIRSLQDAIAFKVRRDAQPQRWYPVRADGTVDRYDDLPPQLRGNVAPVSASLSDAEIEDVAAFLRTLTDGWVGD